jgi:hypothetical protein
MGKRSARISTTSPGIIITLLASMNWQARAGTATAA